LGKAMEVLRAAVEADHSISEAHGEIAIALIQMQAENEVLGGAVLYALRRIKHDADVRRFCGYGSEMFHQLVGAAACYLGKTEDEVGKWYFDNNAKD
jgi:hypothetical protein